MMKKAKGMKRGGKIAKGYIKGGKVKGYKRGGKAKK